MTQQYISGRVADEIIVHIEESLMLGAAYDCMSERERQRLRSALTDIVETELCRVSSTTTWPGPR